MTRRAEVKVVHVAPTRLPRLLRVVVIAFAPYEPRPLLGAVGLFRGIAIQLAYRWPTGQILADRCDRAVLLWSVEFRADWRRSLRRELFGVLAATSVGIALWIVSSSILLVPLGMALWTAGMTASRVGDVEFSVAGTRLFMTLWRAFRAYLNDEALMSRLPSPSTTRWRIDYLAAVPAKSGHGRRLLGEFLDYADKHGAEVVLNCDSRNLSFYRHHGFHQVGVDCPGGQRLMVRTARSVRGPTRAERDLGHQARTRRVLLGRTGARDLTRSAAPAPEHQATFEPGLLTGESHPRALPEPPGRRPRTGARDEVPNDVVDMASSIPLRYHSASPELLSLAKRHFREPSPVDLGLGDGSRPVDRYSP